MKKSRFLTSISCLTNNTKQTRGSRLPVESDIGPLNCTIASDLECPMKRDGDCEKLTETDLRHEILYAITGNFFDFHH